MLQIKQLVEIDEKSLSKNGSFSKICVVYLLTEVQPGAKRETQNCILIHQLPRAKKEARKEILLHHFPRAKREAMKEKLVHRFPRARRLGPRGWYKYFLERSERLRMPINSSKSLGRRDGSLSFLG